MKIKFKPIRTVKVSTLMFILATLFMCLLFTLFGLPEIKTSTVITEPTEEEWALQTEEYPTSYEEENSQSTYYNDEQFPEDNENNW